MDLSGTQWHLSQQTAFSKVWAAASEAKAQPPTDFVWEEQNRFRSSPDCTTILCKSNGEVSVRVGGCHWAASPCAPLLLCGSHFLQSMARIDSPKRHSTSGGPAAVPPVCSPLASRIVASVPCFSRLLQVPSPVDFVLDANGKCGIRKAPDTAFSGQLFIQMISWDSSYSLGRTMHKECSTKTWRLHSGVAQANGGAYALNLKCILYTE